MNENSDNCRLIEGLQSGDEREFQEAFVFFQRKFKKPGQKIIRKLYDLPHSITEEIYQEALKVVIVKGNISSLQDPSKLASWFFQVLKREALQWLRKNKEALKREQFMTGDEWAAVAEKESINSFNERPESLELLAYEEALLQLTPEEQSYVLTELIPELKIKDVALEHGISDTLGRKRKERTMRKLKTLCLQNLRERKKVFAGRSPEIP